MFFAKIDLNTLSLRYYFPFCLFLLNLALVFIFSSYWQSDYLLKKQLDDYLKSQAKNFLEIYEIGGHDLVVKILQKRLNNDNEKDFYLLMDKNYKPILGNLSSWPDSISKNTIVFEIDYFETPESHRDIRFIHQNIEDSFHFLIGRETIQNEILETKIGFQSSIYILFVLFAGAISGILLHRKLNNKLSMISVNCQKIHAGDLSIRFPAPEKGDEIDDMSKTLNDTLDHIQVLMADIQHITNNIAHDLRIPLTRIRQKLEQITVGALTETENKNLLLSAIQDLDHLLVVFNAMLRLSQIEAGTIYSDMKFLNLNNIVLDCVDFFEPVSEAKNQKITVSLPDEMAVTGDRNLLFQAIGNVIENAIKYSPEGSYIEINGIRKNTQCMLTIVDQGPGIDTEEFANITKRFYRLDRSRHHPGNGLGLSLVKAVIGLHNGTITFANKPGLEVSLVFTTKNYDEHEGDLMLTPRSG